MEAIANPKFNSITELMPKIPSDITLSSILGIIFIFLVAFLFIAAISLIGLYDLYRWFYGQELDTAFWPYIKMPSFRASFIVFMFLHTTIVSVRADLKIFLQIYGHSGCWDQHHFSFS